MSTHSLPPLIAMAPTGEITPPSPEPDGVGAPGLESGEPGLLRDAGGRTFQIHPIADTFPALKGDEFRRLKESIRDTGKLLEPLVVSPHEDGIRTLYDGRHRLRACIELGIVPEIREWTGPGDPLDLILGLNVHRRQLLPQQREMLAARLVTAVPGRPAKTGQIRPFTAGDACRLLGVGSTQVKAARILLKQGAPELIAMVDSGKVRLTPAAEVAKELKRGEQSELAGRGAKAVKERARELTAASKCKKSDDIPKESESTASESDPPELDTEAAATVEPMTDAGPGEPAGAHVAFDPDVADGDSDPFVGDSSDAIETDHAPTDDTPGCLEDEAAPIDGGTVPEDEDDSRPIVEEDLIGAGELDPVTLPLHEKLTNKPRYEHEVRFWVQSRPIIEELRLLTDRLLDNDPEFAKCAMAPGSLVRLAVSLASVPHPSLWAECEVCDGMGLKDETSCFLCAGGGYRCSAS